MSSVKTWFDRFYDRVSIEPIAPWLKSLPGKVDQALSGSRWGDLPKWMDSIEQLPGVTPSSIDLNSNDLRVGIKSDCDDSIRQNIERSLRALCPWRKGPFEIFGIPIDTEWRSDMKWNRLKDQIAPLKDRVVLDVGCGNGYHCWRMAGAGAKIVAGVDPTMLYAIQFQALQKYIQSSNVAVFPIGVDDMPAQLTCFDTVFSMGLLYHRRAPFDHLLQLKSFLREGGELVLESIVTDGKQGDVLSPKDRYARMANVWFIPSVLTLESWLKRTQFKNIRCINIEKTTSKEQRVTGWMSSESLANFLNPDNSDETVEGYPAPRRAIFLAEI